MTTVSDDSLDEERDELYDVTWADRYEAGESCPRSGSWDLIEQDIDEICDSAYVECWPSVIAERVIAAVIVEQGQLFPAAPPDLPWVVEYRYGWSLLRDPDMEIAIAPRQP